MMSDPTTVDRTTVDELTGKLVLLIDEPRAWDELPLMHRQLAVKVKNYVRHIRSPAYDQPPSETIIRLVSEKRPGTSSLAFFGRVSYELSKHDLSFEHQLGEDGLPVPVPPTAASTATQAPPGEPGSQTPRRPAAQPPQESRAPSRVEAEASRGPEEYEAEVSPGPDGEARSEPDEADDGAAPEWLPRFADAEDERMAHPAAAEPWLPDLDQVEIEHDPELEGIDENEVEAAGLEAAEQEADQWHGVGPDLSARDSAELESGEGESEPSATPREVVGRERADRTVGRLESLARPESERPKYPPFFPEEEFGRDVPEIEVEGREVALEEPVFETPVLETGSGKRIRLEAPGRFDSGKPERRVERGERPSLLGTLGSALASALAGAAIWGVLAIPADQSAAPLAMAVALMVGMSVRVRGGPSPVFRLIAVILTILGSALGAVLATIALTIKHGGGGPAGIVELVTDPGALLEAFFTYFGLVDAGFVAVAIYIAARISVAKR